MSTTLKGDTFEARACNLMSQAIDNGALGVIPQCCRFFSKKAYYSKDRDDNIIFDFSIEVWLKDAPNYSLLFLGEAKDYASTVPINDLEEFKEKATQVSSAAKLIFITTSKLQKSALNYAKNKGIMLIEVNDQDEKNIIFYSSKSKPSLLLDTDFITTQQELSEIQSFIFTDVNDTNFNWEDLLTKFLKHALAGSLSEGNKVDTPLVGLGYLSKKKIEQLTMRILDDFDPNIQKHYFSVNLNSFVSYLENNFGLKVITDQFIYDEKGREIHACFDPKNNIITIDKAIAESERYAFTLLHEVGHFFLHSELSISADDYDTLSDSSYDENLGKHKFLNQRHWIEWQAKQFAASILMPEWNLKYQLIYFQIKTGIRNTGKMYVDDAPWNIRDFKLTINHLSAYFNVSPTAMQYRLTDLGVLVYGGKFKRPNSIFSTNEKPVKTVSQILNQFFK
ncbi:hypothetical protein DBR43_09525 [Pedobacter sp. KBW06]|uniref:ImmA/IrrE family metallo-endopeptidase n=1 Tax=Pedobacter sp. KBW06 TaxID=2153359 RepID=UPI000F5AD5BE|nr:ImmA/IrrE family metallo-endopeptidase [Pedobacter sp. KBW06]RQO75567.1 hypothetical protein DBR43_09525 [Pedobacter sp. KBW06]